jgi:beta-mannosidase
VEPVPGESDRVDVVVSAHTLVRDLLLQADRLGPRAAADQGLKTLLPGERTRIKVSGCGSVDVEDVRAALFSVDVM